MRRKEFIRFPGKLAEETERMAMLLSGFRNLEGFALLMHQDMLKRFGRWVNHFHALTALVAAHKIGLFDLLQEKRMLSIAQLRRKLRVRKASLQVLLYALESLGIIKIRRDEVKLKGFARLFLGENAIYSLSPFLEFLSLQLKALAKLDETIRTGTPAKEADIFEPSPYSRAYLLSVNRYLYHPARILFQKMSAKEVQDAMMGSMGVSFAAALLEANPEARISFGCLDHLVKQIPELMELYAVDQGTVVSCASHKGDPREDTWGKEAFDLVFLTKKFLLHPDDGIGEAFAEKSFQVLNPMGKVVIWETFYPDGLPDRETALSGLQDLIASRGGALYTRKEMRKILKKIGYSKIDFYRIPTVAGTAEFCVAEKGR